MEKKKRQAAKDVKETAAGTKVRPSRRRSFTSNGYQPLTEPYPPPPKSTGQEVQASPQGRGFPTRRGVPGRAGSALPLVQLGPQRRRLARLARRDRILRASQEVHRGQEYVPRVPQAPQPLCPGHHRQQSPRRARGALHWRVRRDLEPIPRPRRRRPSRKGWHSRCRRTVRPQRERRYSRRWSWT